MHCPTQMPIPDSELFTFDMVPLLTGTTEFPWGPLACNSGKLQIKALPRNRRAKCSWGGCTWRRRHLPPGVLTSREVDGEKSYLLHSVGFAG